MGSLQLYAHAHARVPTLLCALVSRPHAAACVFELAGNCLLACFCLVLECVTHGYVPARSIKVAAQRLRTDLVAWIRRSWMTSPIFNPCMQVHEIMWLQHDLGATPREREEFGEWGGDAASRLHAYERKCLTKYYMLSLIHI